MKKRLIQVLLLILNVQTIIVGQQISLSTFTKTIQEEGEEPIVFVKNKLDKCDLIVFDDALHSALEPFEFYQDLIKEQAIADKLDYLFIEVFNTNSQPYVDKYFNSQKKDSTLLFKVFQDDYSGYGWRYKTYLDLLSTAWDINNGRPDSSKINVVAVSPPIYWEALHTWEDYEIFQNSLNSRDYFMYHLILSKLGRFKNTKKGFFLTNTRHSYKNVKNKDGDLYWNTNTFFNQMNPGKTYSIRIHNVFLSREKLKKNPNDRTSTEGLSEYVYKWVLSENGIWDSAFSANENKPVALDLQNNVFGKSGYLGNHMPEVLDGSTMYHAYDGLIFLKPIDELHFSAQVGFIYTKEFKAELKRRIILLEGDNLANIVRETNAANVDEYIGQITREKPIMKNNLLKK